MPIRNYIREINRKQRLFRYFIRVNNLTEAKNINETIRNLFTEWKTTLRTNTDWDNTIDERKTIIDLINNNEDLINRLEAEDLARRFDRIISGRISSSTDELPSVEELSDRFSRLSRLSRLRDSGIGKDVDINYKLNYTRKGRGVYDIQLVLSCFTNINIFTFENVKINESSLKRIDSIVKEMIEEYVNTYEDPDNPIDYNMLLTFVLNKIDLTKDTRTWDINSKMFANMVVNKVDNVLQECFLEGGDISNISFDEAFGTETYNFGLNERDLDDIDYRKIF